MHLRTLLDEDFVNYKDCNMFICMPYCDFKCNQEVGREVCQNAALMSHPMMEINDDELIKRYLNNSLSKAIVFGGLEPFYHGKHINSPVEMTNFISKLRLKYKCSDMVVIYSGYSEDELGDYIKNFRSEPEIYYNIIIKFGRYIPGKPSRFDDLLSITLASNNQYAKMI